MREELREALRKIERQPQRQDSLNDQICDLIVVANYLGMYDVADMLTRLNTNDTTLFKRRS